VFSSGIIGIMIFVILTTKWNEKQNPELQAETVSKIGTALLSQYLLPFEIASIVLLVALIGSAMYSRRIKD
jgi:NADH:ubiquinone oxidoreductase subunit 6 (subunit J)